MGGIFTGEKVRQSTAGLGCWVVQCRLLNFGHGQSFTRRTCFSRSLSVAVNWQVRRDAQVQLPARACNFHQHQLSTLQPTQHTQLGWRIADLYSVVWQEPNHDNT